jgi:hypothetical protein
MSTGMPCGAPRDRIASSTRNVFSSAKREGGRALQFLAQHCNEFRLIAFSRHFWAARSAHIPPAAHSSRCLIDLFLYLVETLH